MTRPRHTLSRSDIERLLIRLGQLAAERETHVEVFLVGGAAIAMAYNVQRTTGDLDGVFEPKSSVYELARIVAEESGMDLPPDWLNDGVKGFLPGADEQARGILLDAVGISVSVASPRYLFVLKAMAARESDEDDLRMLYPLCEFGSADEALDTVQAAYPLMTIKPNVEYLVRGVAEAHDADAR